MVASVVVLALAGCASHQTMRGPEWLTRPAIAGQVCAVGISGPTLYPEDAIAAAQTKARVELGKVIIAYVRSIHEVHESSSSGPGGDVVQGVTWASLVSEAAIRQSTIREYWVDRHGAVSPARTTYAMACMPEKQAVNFPEEARRPSE